MGQLVSILIPLFNAQQWIARCLDSVLAQTWPRKEIIVVDDGSTDASLEIARSYESSDVVVVTQQNRGASAARNRALSLAQGDFIQWLDADDLLMPAKIAAQIRFGGDGQSCRTLFSGAWGSFYSSRRAAIYRQNSLWETLSPTEWLYRKTADNVWMAPEAWLVSRWLTQRAGPWNERLYRDNDGEYFDRVVAQADSVRFVEEAGSLHRNGTGGISSYRTVNGSKLQSIALATLSQANLLILREDSKRTRDACLDLLRRSSVYFFPDRPDLLKQLQTVYSSLGGDVLEPALGWKYRLFGNVAGWKAADDARAAIRRLHEQVCRKREQLWSLWLSVTNADG